MSNRIVLLSLPLLAASCAAIDPYTRPGVWRPVGANESNLAVMAVRPAERVRGSAEAGVAGLAASTAVERLRTDRVRTLPDSGLARIVTIPSGGGGGN